MLPPKAHLSVAYGGGGVFGIAYGLGVVDALRAAGLPLISAPAIGTSAGAWVAGCTAAGISFADVCQVPDVSVPNLRPGHLLQAARMMFGDSHADQVTASTTVLWSGRRHLLHGEDHHLAEMVAASSAVPFLFAPVLLRGRLLVDGGVRSLVHADQAQPAQHLLAIAPVGGRVCGPAGRAAQLLTMREMRRWQAGTQFATHLIRPNAAIAAMVRSPAALFDYDVARQVFPMAYEQASRLMGERDDLRRLVVEAADRAA
jgi:predicted acylesterase/phospholipase RssA